MGNFEKKAAEYIELMNAEKKTEKVKKELYKLGRQLTARGLDPQHKGLANRARIADYERLVAAFLAEPEGKENFWTKLELLQAGIKPDRNHLRTTLGEIKRNERAAHKLRHTKKSAPPHRSMVIEEFDDLDLEEEDTFPTVEPVIL